MSDEVKFVLLIAISLVLIVGSLIWGNVIYYIDKNSKAVESGAIYCEVDNLSKWSYPKYCD